MSEKPTEKSKYPSIYSPGKFVSGDKFLAEMLCARHAYYEHNELPKQFWQLPRWRDEFVKKIVQINRVLEEYPIEVIIKALRDPKGRKLYSATSPKLKPLLEKYAAMSQISVKEEVEELEVMLGLRESPKETKSLKSRLDD